MASEGEQLRLAQVACDFSSRLNLLYRSQGAEKHRRLGNGDGQEFN